MIDLVTLRLKYNLKVWLQAQEQRVEISGRPLVPMLQLLNIITSIIVIS